MKNTNSLKLVGMNLNVQLWKIILVVYCISDVLLLCDCFISFRKLCLNNYELDPCYCYSIPRLSFQAMLKKTSVELELITDMDQYLFFEKGLRGGIVNTTRKYSEGNNIHLPNYDKNKTPNSILYIDVNNLYGFAMKCKLPVGDYFRLG